jgi:uncharacterized peroxidase-related enzyme
MTWIKTQSPVESHAVSEVLEKLRALYPKEYDASRRYERLLPDLVKNDSIMLSHSLIPQAMYHAFATYGAAMDPSLPLTRRQHEMIATVVSTLNRCFYWIESHAEFLRSVSLDTELAAALKRDWRETQLDIRDHAMLEYVEKITKNPPSIWRDDMDALRKVGFDDTGILQITLIASFFNYINRIADALGVGRE